MDLIDLSRIWLSGMEFSVARTAVLAGGVWLVMWVLFARVLANRKIRPDRPGAPQMRREIWMSIRTLAVFNVMTLPVTLLAAAGLLDGPRISQAWGPGWMALNFVLMAIGHDTYFYWTHRLIHHPRLFRRFHRQHHRSNNPSPFALFSFDTTEAVIQGAFFPLWMLLVPTDSLTVILFTTFSITLNAIGHSGYEVFPATKDGKPLFPWLVTVTHHDLHHQNAGSNYSFYFSVWDRLMGTLHPDYDAKFAAAVRAKLPQPRAEPEREVVASTGA